MAREADETALQPLFCRRLEEPRSLSAGQELIGAALNSFAGTLDVLSEAVGSLAADADDGEDRGGKEQKNQTLH